MGIKLKVSQIQTQHSPHMKAEFPNVSARS